MKKGSVDNSDQQEKKARYLGFISITVKSEQMSTEVAMTFRSEDQNLIETSMKNMATQYMEMGDLVEDKNAIKVSKAFVRDEHTGDVTNLTAEQLLEYVPDGNEEENNSEESDNNP